MDIGELTGLIGAVLVLVVAGAALGGAWALGRLQGERSRGTGLGPRADEEDGKLRRLEQAVDAMAIELERLSELQRYSAKLLTERASTPAERSVPPLG
jgi:hypothetical protein